MTFKVGDRVRFAYPNAPWGAGRIIDREPQDPAEHMALKTYTVRLDTPHRAFREGHWDIYLVAYADEELLEPEGALKPDSARRCCHMSPKDCGGRLGTCSNCAERMVCAISAAAQRHATERP